MAMTNKTKIALVGNIESIMRPFKGRILNQVVPGGVDNSSDTDTLRRCHLTPHDIASIIVAGLNEQGYSVRKSTK